MEPETVVDNLFAVIKQPMPELLHVYECQAWDNDIGAVVLNSWVRTSDGYEEDEEVLIAVQILPCVKIAETCMGCCKATYESKDDASVKVWFTDTWVPFKTEGA